MKEEVKVAATAMMKMPAVCGHNMGVPPARPVHGMEEYFDYLFSRHGRLETPPIPAPRQAHMSSSLKKDR